jgi:hypothetical protein
MPEMVDHDAGASRPQALAVAQLGPWLHSRASLALLPIALAAVVFFPVTGNYFYQDDFLYLYRIVNRGLLEHLLTPHGGHVLIARNAIFWLFYQLFGAVPVWYFAIVLLTHLLNVYLLFSVIRAHTGSAAMACFGAALWGTCRMDEGALGWYSVYGQVLVGTALLWLLTRLDAVAAGAPVSRYAPARWGLLLLVATTCFGLGLAVALVSPLVAWLLLPRSRTRTAIVGAFCVAALASALLYGGAQWLHTSLYGGTNQLPRLVGLLQSPGLVATFAANLSLAGVTGLCLGSLVAARTYPNPTSLAVAGAILLALAAALVRSPARARARLIAYVLLAAACYGSIAIARAALVQRVPAAAAEARYHYVALIPITLLVCELLRRATRSLGAAEAPVLVLAALATPVLSYHRPLPLLYDPSPARRETEAILARIHARAAADGSGPLCMANGSFSGIASNFVANPRLEFPGWAALYAVFEPDDTINGRRIYFVERSNEVLRIASRGRRSAALIVAPDRAAALGCQDPS